MWEEKLKDGRERGGSAKQGCQNEGIEITLDETEDVKADGMQKDLFSHSCCEAESEEQGQTRGGPSLRWSDSSKISSAGPQEHPKCENVCSFTLRRSSKKVLELPCSRDKCHMLV